MKTSAYTYDLGYSIGRQLRHAKSDSERADMISDFKKYARTRVEHYNVSKNDDNKLREGFSDASGVHIIELQDSPMPEP